MKKSLSILLATIALCCLTFMSCTPTSSSTDGSSQNNGKAKYTVMLYGAGGEDLDDTLLNNLGEQETFFKNNLDCNINLVAMFNMSEPYKDKNTNTEIHYQTDPEYAQFHGTMHWYMTKDGWNKSKNIKEIQTLHNPAVLTNYIKDTVKNFPAEKYVLILSNHGGAFSIADQPVDSEVTTVDGNAMNRSVINDQNNGNYFFPLSLFGIKEGIANSGIKMELIYFDCCLNGQIETLYQLKDQTNYIVSSSNVTYNSNHVAFLNGLMNSSITAGMTEYLKTPIKDWKANVSPNDSTAFFDISLTDMSKVENVAENFKALKSSLLTKYDLSTMTEEDAKTTFKNLYKLSNELIKWNGVTEDKIPDAVKNGTLYYFDHTITPNKPEDIETGSSVDMRSLINALCKPYLSDTTIKGQLDSLNKALDDLVITQNTDILTKGSTTLDYPKKPLGLVFVPKSNLTEKNTKYQKYNTFESVYKKLDWDQKTGWSEFLLKNDID